MSSLATLEAICTPSLALISPTTPAPLDPITRLAVMLAKFPTPNCDAATFMPLALLAMVAPSSLTRRLPAPSLSIPWPIASGSFVMTESCK